MKFVVSCAALSLLISTSAFAGNPAGTWMSSDGGTKVRVDNCGNALCARVVWLKEPVDPQTGKPKTDKRNPDKAKQSRPMIGVQVVAGMKPNGENKWSGRIYNADDGKTYSSNITLLSDDKMKVEGCVLSVLCKGESWTRTN
jgi:uncharacterized protein (DUF2147 family)